MKTNANAPINVRANVELNLSEIDYTALSKEVGLTKREYFAALAMQALTSTCHSDIEQERSVAELVAQTAVIYADKLIEVLNEQP